MHLAALAAWRKDGLLPPLACHGLGQGRGKTYYWREEDIVPHARAAFDFLQKYGRPDAAIRMLWLSGFPVPLPQLRRALLHDARHRRQLKIKPVSKPRERSSGILEISESGHDSPQFLLNLALLLCDAFVPDENDEIPAVTGVIHRALRRLSRTNRRGDDNATAERFWFVIQMMSSTLEASNLISTASDADLREAQHYLCVAGRFLQKCANDEGPRSTTNEGEPFWSNWLAERIGPSLFLLILVMLRTGRRDALDRIARKMDHAGSAMLRPGRSISMSRRDVKR
jgi:hypothetical protein